MKITKMTLFELHACAEGIEYYDRLKTENSIIIFKNLLSDKKFDWASWLIVRLLNHHNQIKYAIYSAELCLSNFEKIYSKDKRPRNAINAAKTFLKSEDNMAARSAWSAAWSAARSAESAAWSAESAAWSARSARSAAWSAAWSAESAARSAESAAWSARSAESAAWSARSAESAAWSARSARSAAWSARSAESAAWSAESAAWKKIIKYGLKLLKDQK